MADVINNKMNLDTPRVSESSRLFRRLPSPAQSEEALFPTVLQGKMGRNGFAVAAWDTCSSNNEPIARSSTERSANSSTVSFGGKQKSPFIGKTLPSENSDDDDYDQEHYRNGTTAPPRLQRTSFGSEEGNSHDANVYVENDQTLKQSSSEDEDSCDEVSNDDRDEVFIEKKNEKEDGCKTISNNNAMESDTEEEELKVNNIGHDDDNAEGACSDDSLEDDSSDEEVEAPWSHLQMKKDSSPGKRIGKTHLVTFVSGKTAASALGKHVHRPKPRMGGSPSPSADDNSHRNIDSEEASSDDESSSASSSSSSSSASIGGGRRLSLTLDANASSASDDEPDTDQVSSAVSDSVCSDSIDGESLSSSDGSDDSIRSADVEDEDEAQVVESDGLRLREQSKISSPMEMELDRAIDATDLHSGNENLSSTVKANIKRTEDDGKHCPRNSISVEDLEEIIKEPTSDSDDSGLETELHFSDDEQDVTEEGRSSVKTHAEISVLLSDALEFDCWSSDVLLAAIALLDSSSNCAHRDMRNMEHPIHLPDSSCTSFWIDMMLATIAPESVALQELINSPTKRVHSSKIIHDAFHSQLSSLNLSYVDYLSESMSGENTSPTSLSKCSGRHLFIGSLAVAESRLALAALHIKHIVHVSCNPLDELWVADGVKYYSHILPSCESKGSVPVSKTITRATSDVVSALQDDIMSSVLVACSTGDEYSCAVCALFLMHSLDIERSDAITKIARARPSSKVEPDWIEFSTVKDTVSPPTDSTQKAPFAKRMLSSQMLTELVGLPSLTDSPKRQRVHNNMLSNANTKESSFGIPPLPFLNLGSAGLPCLRMRNREKHVSSTEDESNVVYERYLSEELDERHPHKAGESTPIPLLTPPASPVVVQSEVGETTVCEWPSNLAVDAAMTATMSLRPLSPSSLVKQEEENERINSPSLDYTKTPKSRALPDPTTGLTPKFTGIQVSHQ